MTMGLVRFGPFAWDEARRQLRLHETVVPLDASQAQVFIALVEGRDVPQASWDAVGSINRLLEAQGHGNCFIAHHPSDGFSFVVEARERVVGREKAVTRIADQLVEHRFVTVVGPGGLGKTTVARLLGESSRNDYPDGVYFVDLARLADGRLVAAAAGTSMGLALAGTDPLASLSALARHKRMLLVLDSCEHVTEHAARVAEAVLGAGPGVHVLATSREPLGAAGERLHRLAVLDAAPSVELFLRRARERNARFHPTAQGLVQIAAICRQLDGLPLAIEIVAARASELGLDDLARQLDERLLFVEVAVSGDAPARHQTLAAMMDWSHGKLGPLERAALRHLSIFRGRFTLDAAQAVVKSERAGVDDVHGAVLDLADKSLVSQAGQGRFRLLDTTRVYAGTKLEAGERGALARRHAVYLLAVLKQAEADWMVMDVRAWQAEYGEWIDDLRLALDWCFGKSGDGDLGVALAFSGFELARQLSVDMHFKHYMALALRVLEQRQSRDYLTEITLKAYLGSMGQLVEVEGTPVQRALEEMMVHESSRIPARVQIIAVSSITHGSLMAADFATATYWADRANVAARDSGDAVACTIAERMNAQASHFMGKHAQAERLALSVLAASSRIPLTYIPSPVEPRVSMRLLLARLHWMQGRPRTAARWAEECMQHAETDTAISRCQVLAMCAVPLALWQRERERAGELAHRLHQLAERHSLGYWLYWAERIRLVVAFDPADAGASPDPRLFKSGTSEANLRDHLVSFDDRLMGDDVQKRVADGLVGWCAPEVLRARAAAAMRRSSPDAGAAERFLLRAVALSREQGALAWELRSATALARLYRSTARVGEGRAQLAATIARFEPGAATVDLLEAGELLKDLAPPH